MTMHPQQISNALFQIGIVTRSIATVTAAMQEHAARTSMLARQWAAGIGGDDAMALYAQEIAASLYRHAREHVDQQALVAVRMHLEGSSP